MRILPDLATIYSFVIGCVAIFVFRAHVLLVQYLRYHNYESPSYWVDFAVSLEDAFMAFAELGLTVHSVR
jgi:hypothetical protein